MTEQKQHFLLVEDNPRDVEITLDALADSGVAAHVTVLSDGEEAFDYVHRRGKFRLRAPGEPALILLDVKMPKVNGLEVLQHLKTNPAFAGIPIVMVSSSRQEHDFIAAYELHAEGYLTKPVKPEQLAKTIESALERKR